MKNGLHIRLTSCSWCAAKWVWPQPTWSTRWHWGWWVFSNWRARAPQAAPDRPMQGAMIAPGRTRADTPLRWPPCRLSRSPWLTQWSRLSSLRGCVRQRKCRMMWSGQYTIWKSDGSVRLGLDLSSPRGASVTSDISREEFAVRYTSVDAAVAIVRSLGRNAFMAKADIRHAFRLCPVRPAAWPLLCYTWGERVYVDLRLPFGARSSLFIFTQFAEALHWIAVQFRGCRHVLHYLDDYFLARASHAACARDLQAFQDLCRDLGVPLASEKLVLPARCLQFLGITLDSSLQERRLPPDKLARLRDCLPAWRTRQKCTKRELLSLIGVLSFACKVVRPGRIFLRRLIALSMTVPALAHHISLTTAARADIAWWVEFLPSWNGRAFIPPPPVAAAALGFATDASGVGLGAVFGLKWLYAAWPPPSALIKSMSWSYLQWRSPSIAGARNGMTHRFSCTRTTCRWCRFGRRARVSTPTSCRLCAGFSFSLHSRTWICFWRTWRAARILTLICFPACRWRSSGPEHAGHCLYRRWFRLTFGSGFNTTTSTAGKLRGCQHVTGLRVRAE